MIRDSGLLFGHPVYSFSIVVLGSLSIFQITTFSLHRVVHKKWKKHTKRRYFLFFFLSYLVMVFVFQDHRNIVYWKKGLGLLCTAIRLTLDIACEVIND